MSQQRARKQSNMAPEQREDEGGRAGVVRWWEWCPTLLVCAEEDNGVVYADSRSSAARVSEMDEREPGCVWGSVHAQSGLRGQAEEVRGEEDAA